MAELALNSALPSPTPPAWEEEEGLLEGQEWGDHCLRAVLTGAGSISQQSCRKGAVSITLWQVRKLSFRANVTSEVVDLILVKAFQGQPDFMAIWPQ